MDPLVSIIIPAYNAATYIDQTIHSAIDQKYKNIEIIVVDDGSQDNTYELAKRYEAINFKVIRQKNSGPCAARNNGFKISQGEYIQWLDADDLLDTDKIELQIKSSEGGGDSKVLLSGSMAMFYFRHKNAQFYSNTLWRTLDPIDWIITKYNDNVYIPVHAWLTSRKLTELAGPWDDRLWRTDGDGEYFCRVVSASDKVKFVSDSKCYYRQAISNSLSSTRVFPEFEILLKELYCRHLLKLEDTPRTKRACKTLLQTWVDGAKFADPTIPQYANNIAKQIGMELDNNPVNCKLKIASKFLGKKNTLALRNFKNIAIQKLYKNWDYVLYRLEKL